jgi:peptidoglycan hydrolase-like protein with peptidoglycan-binding domain
MKISTDELAGHVAKARSRGWLPVIAKAEARHKLPAGLLLAVASRETNMEDICGDGGHGRGLFQIDDRFHGDWLAGHGAPGTGTTPRLADAAEFAAAMFASNLSFGRQKGVGGKDLMKYACSAYNAGAGGALEGFRGGDSDRKTAGGDYGRDVLDRLAAIQSRNGGGRSLQMSGGAEPLQQGAKGKNVARFKRDLQAWFDREAPGVWATFKIKPGPLYGASVVKAVREFQLRNALTVDGEAGPETLAVLASAAAPEPATEKQKKAAAATTTATKGILKRGDRGPAVTLLKRDLQAWFDRAAPGAWDAFSVTGGPGFGPGLDRAVRNFQQRNGLLVDGEVGKETLNAIHGAKPSKTPLPGPREDFPDLELDSPKKVGSTGVKVRLIQGWLSLHGFKVVVDGGYGKATARQVRAFQTAKSLPVTGVVDKATWAKLVHPMRVALSPIAPNKSLGQMIAAYARQHLAQHPQEAGGENSGPWVRLYTNGQEGKDFPWCAGFATFILEQASTALHSEMLFPKTLACDSMQAGAGARLLSQPTPSQRVRITPGSFFLRPNSSGKGPKYAHTGIVVQADADTFKSIEGNTNDEGSAEGFEVCARVHGYQGLDFIII